MPGVWGITPRESVEAECRRLGKEAVVAGCVDALAGRDVDNALLLALGGPHASLVLGGRAGGRYGHWPRVWAARGLLYAWDDVATRAVIAATSDTAWRVREMAVKVIAHHRLGNALGAAAKLQADPVERVRTAARRAVRILAEAHA
ncbi:MAG: HEAT repeat domain-containing protein [Candidatus Dormibacteria bacterium]